MTSLIHYIADLHEWSEEAAKDWCERCAWRTAMELNVPLQRVKDVIASSEIPIERMKQPLTLIQHQRREYRDSLRVDRGKSVIREREKIRMERDKVWLENLGRLQALGFFDPAPMTREEQLLLRIPKHVRSAKEQSQVEDLVRRREESSCRNLQGQGVNPKTAVYLIDLEDVGQICFSDDDLTQLSTEYRYARYLPAVDITVQYKGETITLMLPENLSQGLLMMIPGDSPGGLYPDWSRTWLQWQYT